MPKNTQTEQKNQGTGAVVSGAVHLAIALLMFLVPMGMHKMDPPPPEPGGILVALGEPDKGQGDDPAPQGQQMDDPSQTKEVDVPKESPPKPAPSKPVPAKPATPPPTKTTPTKTTPAPSKVVTEDPAAVRVREQQAAAKKKRDDEERSRADAAAKTKAAKDAADAATKAKAAKDAADAKARADAKGKFGSKLGQGGGQGQGNTGKPGNQGDPNGDPSSKVLDGISTGSGTIGGGLKGRATKKKAPKVEESSNSEGTVTVEVCVDSNGNIASAIVTQKGTTTTDSKLRAAAVANAKLNLFEGKDIDKQCGTITYIFTAH